MSDPSVAIIMPVREWVHTGTNRSILRLKIPKPTHYFDKTDCPVEAARNILTAAALREVPELTHLLFIDDDMIFDADAFERLVAHDLPIVGGLCHNRRPPYMPILMREYNGGYAFVYDYDREVDERGLIEVDATGAAFLLVKREVFEKIAETKEEPFTIRGPGEDISFCLRAKEKGYKIFVDTTVEIGHVGEVTVTSDFARRNRDFMIFPWVDPAKRPIVKGSDVELPPARMRGDEVTPEARRARARYAFAGKEIAKRIRVGGVLDFGCGTGYGCPILAREALIRGSNVAVVGYDLDPLAVAFGRDTFWPMLTTIDGAVEGPVDAITCFNVLQHAAEAGEDGIDTLRYLIARSPIVIGSLPSTEFNTDDLVLPGSIKCEFYGQRADGMIGVLDDQSLDMIFVITR
jgi:hypothetical protein